MTIVHLSQSPEETDAIAHAFVETLSGGDRIGLCGSLGAGKTRFMQGVAAALPLAEDEPLSSPSFPIINTYPLKTGGTLYHIDVYRLESWQGFVEIGGEELLATLGKDSYVFIEWADQWPELVMYLDWKVDIQELGDHSREITIIRRQ